MPPLQVQGPLALAGGAAWPWRDLAVAFADVASEPLVLALVAVAIYAWLESEVKCVVSAFLPLAAALAACSALALVTPSLNAAPSSAAAGEGGAPVLGQALQGAQVAPVAAFAVYSLLAYGRRAVAALVLVGAIAAGWALSGPRATAGLAAAAAQGAALGLGAYLAALRLFPRGHLASLRTSRGRSRRAGAGDPPSA
jgi:hypothetical protein